MAKQKIVIQVTMKDDKMRSRVQKTVVTHYGVAAVKIEGDNRDQVAIEGEGLDVVKITRSLRIKMWPIAANVVSVEVVKDKKKEEEEKKKKEEEEKKKKKEQEKADEEKFRRYPYVPPPYFYETPYYQEPSCSVM